MDDDNTILSNIDIGHYRTPEPTINQQIGCFSRSQWLKMAKYDLSSLEIPADDSRVSFFC
jgi:hypothetical protein